MSRRTPQRGPQLEHRRRNFTPYLLLIPNFIFLTLFTFYPFVRNIYLSFFVTDQAGNPGAYVGLKNYIRVFTSDTFRNSLVATIKYAGLMFVGTFVLAMFFAFLCVEKRRSSKAYQTMFALPIALASVPVASIMLYIFSRNGILNQILGTTNTWLSSEKTALLCVAICSCWASAGTSFIFLLVGFRNVSNDLLESATLDGAGYVTKFFKVYVPIASPQIFFVIFLDIITSFKSFALISILVGAGPNESTNVLIYALYNNAFYRGRFETACVYAIALCALIFIVTRIQLLCEKKVVFYQ